MLTDEPSDVDQPVSWGDRWATWIFAVAAVVAFPYILYQGREHWFFLDDYDFLSARSLGNFGDLMRSHNGHWSTLPIVEYRVLYHFFGLNHFWPYQVVVVLAHIATATLLYVVMRRARVNAWIATAAGVVFLYLGSGADDIEFAFQIGFTGALACGLVFLLLTDHDGARPRRDVVGMLFGLAALMFSAVGVAAVAAVGLAALLRRGWRAALVLVGPLAAVFVLWYVTYGRQAPAAPAPSFTETRVFVWAAVSNVFGQLEHIPPFGWILAAVLLAGTVVAVRSSTLDELRRRDAAICGLFLGGLAFIAITTLNRAWAVSPGNDAAARVGRYLYVTVAFMLPAIAAGASYLAGRRPVAVAVVVALLLVGLPGNVDHLYPQDGERFVLGRPGLLEALARSPLLFAAPAAMHPVDLRMPGMTAAWLRGAAAGGKLPRGGASTAGDRAIATLAFSLEQVAKPVPSRDCRPVDPRAVDDLHPGELILLPKGETTVSLIGDRAPLADNAYLATGGRVLRVLEPVRVRIGQADQGGTSQICSA